MTLVWRPQLSVGHEQIDADHQHLISVVSKDETELRARNQDGVQRVLAELRSYGIQHFAREESIARQHGYPGASRLHESHERLLKELAVVFTEFTDDWSDSAVDHFIGFLRDWVINHVIKEDMRMKPWFEKTRVTRPDLFGMAA